MNRSLLIPAGCCLVAFVALLAVLQGAPAPENAAEAARARRTDRKTVTVPVAYSASPAPSPRHNLLSAEEAEQVLTTLAGEYVRPWRQRETSPRHLYSRAAPRPIPTISERIELAREATSQTDSYLVATIVISTGATTQEVPCVVNRATKRVQLFANDEWLTEQEWLKQAPLP